MAYSDHLTAVIDPWILRTGSYLDPWLADAFARDSDVLTRALKVSLSSPPAAATPSSDSNTNSASSDTSLAGFTPDVVSSFLVPTPGLNTTTGFGSGSFEMEDAMQGIGKVTRAEPPAPKQRQRNGGVVSGKVMKRKSRATKRSQTTFITTDPASFRQMVQQVTGSRLGGHNPAFNIREILRPEAHRPGNRLPVPSFCSLVGSNSSSSSLMASDCLPTLDTSAFLLDSHRAQVKQQAADTLGQGSVDPVATPQVVALTDDDFEPFGSFPTLESWNSM